jgi:hypothetical protein
VTTTIPQSFKVYIKKKFIIDLFSNWLIFGYIFRRKKIEELLFLALDEAFHEDNENAESLISISGDFFNLLEIAMTLSVIKLVNLNRYVIIINKVNEKIFEKVSQ